MLTIDEAIAHAREKAKELSDKAYAEVNKTLTEDEAYECNECASEHEQLALWLEELAKRREADRWIPVSERLPEPHVAVMVYCPEYKNQYCASYDNKQWKVFGSHVTIWDEVTCWKPLSHDTYESEAENE